MTQYKVDVIGEQDQEKIFDCVDEAIAHAQHLVAGGKKVEIMPFAVIAGETPIEGEGEPKSTDTETTDDTDEPATDPKDADIDATDTDDEDDDDDGELSGEELDAEDENSGV